MRSFQKFFFSFVILPALTARSQDYPTFPMWNVSLPLETRVNDLISRLTLEEKVAQMLNEAPAIPRLGIPAYDWWNEILHGVARTPYHVTSFPQAIAMAATWDTASIHRMAEYAATEGRAIFNHGLNTNKAGKRYEGLTYWTPNINIFRDPRWGRGQETYGEDPYLAGMMAGAFIRGLQGNDPRYLRAAACAKHFAVHSGPEPSRHSDNFNPSVYDLWDTYLPAFRESVVNARVAGIMCAYNAVFTQPCCANDLLMNDILRNQWKFTGYVTSDCWAVDDFFRYHKTHKDALSSATDAVLHGTDLECGRTVYQTLVEAVRGGHLKEEQLDSSLRRLFMIRYRLGMFDPPSAVKYAQIPITVLEAPAHRAHALTMARQSIVLLKNDSHILPLSKKVKKIAVLGPNADNRITLLGNYNGAPSNIVTVLAGIREKLGNNATIVYEQAVDFASDTVFTGNDISRYFQYEGKTGVQSEFFANENLQGPAFYTQMQKDFDFYRTEGHPPATGMESHHYTARFTTDFSAPADESLNFETEGDDGYRVFINDSIYVDAWPRHRGPARSFQLDVKKGARYRIVLEFYQSEGNAFIRLKAGNRRRADFNALVKRVSDADAIIFVGGISPQLEGEEMPVAVPGFKGGDRTSILLPAAQTKLLQALKSTGRPVVFVMMTGSALAIPWENQNIPAIINAWYGGQSAGTAIADVLFGDYNPAGRLPVTFYKSDSDLPSFMEYDMTGRTYRYFRGETLYPFGYGLSYTTFNYSGCRAPASLAKNRKMTVSAMVKNTGEMDGEEVVQLYISHQDVNGKAPLRALKGFQRIALKAGQSKRITFTLTPEQLSLVSEADGKLFQPRGKVTISVGGGQPGITHYTTSNVINKVVMIQ